MMSYTLNRNILNPSFIAYRCLPLCLSISESVSFLAHYISQIPFCVKALGVRIGVQARPSKSQRPHILSIVLERSVLFYERWPYETMETITQVKELTPDYRMWMAGKVAKNDSVVWQYQRMMVAGVIRKRLSWPEIQTMKNRVERLAGCNKTWDTETYEASNVKILLRSFLCKDKFCPNCQAVKRMVLWNRLWPYMEQHKDSLYHMTLTVPDCKGADLYVSAPVRFCSFSPNG